MDTHVWLWLLAGAPELSQEARERIGSGEDCWISPISAWEAGKLAERGRIRVQPTFRRWLGETRRKVPLREALLSFEIAATSLELNLPHQDPADRFLAATALVYELTLITADRRLLAAEWLPTISC